ncbi:hypothetical protein STEG23_033966, partial [Scotinomys teguina]
CWDYRSVLPSSVLYRGHWIFDLRSTSLNNECSYPLSDFSVPPPQPPTLDNPDEQAAQIRRELDGRLQMADQIARERKFPKFVSKEMENMYIEELKSSVNLLMANLESMPVSKGGEFKLQKLKRSHNASIIDMGEESENQLSKSDVLLSFSLEVVIMEVQGLKSLAPNRIVYCTMEVEGGEKLQTDQAEASKPTNNRSIALNDTKSKRKQLLRFHFFTCPLH